MNRSQAVRIGIFIKALLVCILLIVTPVFAEPEIATAIAMRRAAADEALQQGKFAEGAKNLQWIADQSADEYGIADACAELGYIYEYALAYIHLYGLGVKKDEVMAAQWMKQATAGFNPHALYLLGVMTARGIGVEKSAGEARALFVRTAEFGSQDAIDALQSSRPALPEPYRRTASAKTVCSDINVVRQIGFPKPGQAEDFEDFRQGLRYDLVDMMTRQPESGKSEAPAFADSIDDGVKGKSLVGEITKMAGGPGLVPPMWGLLQSIFATTCPVGYGGHFTDDLERDLELWYVTVNSKDNSDELSGLKTRSCRSMERYSENRSRH